MLVIGIAGGTGSGKSTLTNTVAGEFAPNVTVLRHDDYYKAHDELTYEERCQLNYDEPAAFDNDLFYEHIRLLKEGYAVECPVYDYTVHNRSQETVTVKPNDILVVEGILIFADPAFCEMCDIKIFVDTDADIRLMRRIKRDVNKRGRTLESVLAQYVSTVKPMHDKYVQPSRSAADIVVLEGGKNRVALDMLRSHVKRYLEENT